MLSFLLSPLKSGRGQQQVKHRQQKYDKRQHRDIYHHPALLCGPRASQPHLARNLITRWSWVKGHLFRALGENGQRLTEGLILHGYLERYQ